MKLNFPRLTVILLKLRGFGVYSLLIVFGCNTGQKNQTIPSISSPLVAIVPEDSKAFGDDRLKSSVVSLDLVDDEDRPYRCTASLLSDKIAISAAHCFEDFILGGSAEINGVTISILDVFTHPKRKDRGIYAVNDIAVLKLNPNTTKSFLQVDPSTKVLVGDTILTTGFGLSPNQTQSSKTSVIPKVRRLEVTFLSPEFIKARIIGEGEPICTGDSGGPAVLEKEGRLILIGILSSGKSEECTKEDETVFINLNSPQSQKFLRNRLK